MLQMAAARIPKSHNHLSPHSHVDFDTPWEEVPLSEAALRVLAREEAKGALTISARRAVAEVERRRWVLMRQEMRTKGGVGREAFWNAFDSALELTLRRGELFEKEQSIQKEIEAEYAQALTSANEQYDYWWKRDDMEAALGAREESKGLKKEIAYKVFNRVEQEIYQPLFAELGVDLKAWHRDINRFPGTSYPQCDVEKSVLPHLRKVFPWFLSEGNPGPRRYGLRAPIRKAIPIVHKNNRFLFNHFGLVIIVSFFILLLLIFSFSFYWGSIFLILSFIFIFILSCIFLS